MDQIAFEAARRELDREIDLLGADPKVGVTLGFSFYSEFRKQGLLTDKVADFILWKWTLPSYRSVFVREGPEAPDFGFKIGSRDA